MATASDYPVTTGYGQVPGYPLNGGFHRGEDRAMPVGTPVVVNGVTIGLSGNTGASTGPHLHIGKWQGGTVVNPSGGGFTLNNATVSLTGNDTSNGNFVKITDGSGYTWVYLHLSQIKVSKGQKLEGGEMEANEGDLANIFEAVYCAPVTQGDKDYWLGGGKKWTFKDLFYAIKNSERYAIDHFVNDGDIANMKDRNITATGAKGMFWKDAAYKQFKGSTGEFKEAGSVDGKPVYRKN